MSSVSNDVVPPEVNETQESHEACCCTGDTRHGSVSYNCWQFWRVCARGHFLPRDAMHPWY